MKKLKVLCPQEYLGFEMRVVPCTRCANWENEACSVYMGVEHLPQVENPPDCPISSRCQHQIQALPSLCAVRAKGMVCESAYIFSGQPIDPEISFNASDY